MSLKVQLKKRTRINILLLLFCLLLIGLLVRSLYADYLRYQSGLSTITSPSQLQITRSDEQGKAITINKKESGWVMTQPYQHQASMAIVEAIVGRLATTCHGGFADSEINSRYFAEIKINNIRYEVGEINPSADKVYIRQGEKVQLCDKILSSIALAPAVNFIDKNLFKGQLQRIKSNFTESNDVTGFDFSVIEIATANEQSVTADIIGSLTFITDTGEYKYEVLIRQEGGHTLLFEPTKSIIYVISEQPKLNKILGL